ncbi:hypothetical protein [Mycolicibacterium sarraceniae]|uniref:Uncharacterized protein n=1 Tax=Mycolicibacterium sarraceniae TaxID=1534348 RepID=A0A7I7SP47_9MYCO|nr:hypothetical protein [Mycolicibacterium sarraceniae]BBY58568.1 hypothetical protein MSAR_17040 [Mycolicibacterium sarraceniae]
MPPRSAAAICSEVWWRSDAIGRAALDSDAYRGALQVITRDELLEQAGGEQLSDRELAEHAAALDMAVSELGG